MLLSIDKLSEFLDAPMTLRRLWPERANDYGVRIRGMTAGRITEEPMAGGAMVWTWGLTGPVCVDRNDLRVPGRGSPATLNQAKRDFKAAFLTWANWVAQELATGRKAGWYSDAAPNTLSVWGVNSSVNS
jgi:hypothetical protein